MSSSNVHRPASKATPRKESSLSLSQRRRIFERAVALLFITYALLTLFPFYVLLVRTFVGTKDSTELHLGMPPQEEVNLDAEIGRLAIYYNLDLTKFKQDMGIPATELLPTRKTLKRLPRSTMYPKRE